MKSPRNSRRTAVALAISTTFHVVILALLLSQAAPDYQLPESVAPPMDVKIIPEPPPRPVIIERLPPLKPPVFKVLPAPQPKPQPQPQPSKPQPAPPSPPTPAPTPPPTPAPPKPTPQPPKPTPPAPTLAKPLPAVAPRPETKPAPTPTPPLPPTTPAPPTPAPPAPPAPPSPPAPMHLNIHKPEKQAPGSVATLPFAPAPAGSPAAGAPAASASGEPALGGSRLNGLSPYPYGVMPNGGGGLRGTLIGCANAEAVSLSAAERARCNERFGSEAASAPVIDSMSPTKRAAFDKAAERQDRSLQYRDSTPTARTANHPLSPDGTSRGPGSVIAAEPPQ